MNESLRSSILVCVCVCVCIFEAKNIHYLCGGYYYLNRYFI